MNEILAGYDTGWLIVAACLLVPAMFVASCRQVLGVYSRKVLFEEVPDDRRPAIEAHLDQEEEYAASLRSFDLLLRLSLVLSLAFARWSAMAAAWAQLSFWHILLEYLLLGALMLILFVLLLEVAPGIIVRLHPEAALLRRLRAMDAVHRVLGPLRAVSSGMTRIFVKLLGGSGDRPTADIVEEEILNAAEEGEKEGLIGSRDIDMIESIIAYGTVEVSEVMTPRTEMVCLDLDDPLNVNLRRAVDCGHSRIPVYRDSKDKVLGILYVKDLLRYWETRESLSLEAIARKPHFVPLAKKIGELFQEFKTQRFHIAIVLDEFGGVAGLVTIEDIIEEIVGEIGDEHERLDRPAVKRLGPGWVEVDGSLRIGEANDLLEIEIPEGDAYDTVGGFLYSRMGKIPAVGDIYELPPLRFEVASADQRRIRRLRIRFPAAEAPAPLGEAPASDALQGGPARGA
jgi:CBS domain containing-hemolysin-like protein